MRKAIFTVLTVLGVTLAANALAPAASAGNYTPPPNEGNSN
jgi:hypothetical protein